MINEDMINEDIINEYVINQDMGGYDFRDLSQVAVTAIGRLPARWAVAPLESLIQRKPQRTTFLATFGY